MPNSTLPKHIGFIVDGNRRWAKEHGLPTYEGHLAGYNACQDVVKAKSISFLYRKLETFKARSRPAHEAGATVVDYGYSGIN